MSKVIGTLRPIHDNIIISDMEFGEEQTKTGILLTSDNGKSSGVHPRWAKVFAVGHEQTNVSVGEWILLEHGRWSRGFTYVTESGDEIELRLADKNAILLTSSEKPEDSAMRNYAVGAGSNVNFNIPGA